MECMKCNIKKLSYEFPQKRLSSECRHRPYWCIKCILYAGDRKTCDDCESPFDEGIIEDLTCQFNLITQADSLKPPPPRITSISVVPRYSIERVKLQVSLIGGNTKEYEISSSETISGFMKLLEREFCLPSNLQRLVHNGQQLMRYIKGEEAQLCDYGITNGSSLQLMKLLLSITEENIIFFKNIMFRLTYGQGAKMKFLDASCLAYSGNTFYGTVDFKNVYSISGISHSGPAGRTGKHAMQVRLDALSTAITSLFFVMSACHASYVRNFVSPTVSLFETSRPTEQLSTYSISARGYTEAVIMCCMQRNGRGWQVFSLGMETDGYCYKYYPIQQTIAQLFASKTV